MASNTTSHRILLDRIKKTRVRDQIVAKNDNPRIACRREFRREPTNQRVHFALHDALGGRVAWGTAVLVDYSPNGALLGHILFEEGFWPDGDFSVSFKVTGGPHEGVYVYGTPLRFATSRANLALRFDGLYVKL
ncbi:MAG: hypothetical protein H6841_04105 [Planctomycetes bacterium]|nr:hypothetical protein [Planctomycetota bacterium]MCB9934559.1 hypothetical protein [Planctomycetota bacterium]